MDSFDIDLIAIGVLVVLGLIVFSAIHGREKAQRQGEGAGAAPAGRARARRAE